MAIQFPCSSCNKLIEVDDEMAGRWAVCPYCQSTVQSPDKAPPVPGPAAPAEADAASGPIMLGLDSEPDASPPTAPVPPFYAPPPKQRRGNALGNWGLAISLLSWGTIVVMLGWLLVEVSSSPLFEKTAEPTPEEVQHVILEIAKDPKKGRIPALFGLAAAFFALVGVIVSIVGLTRPNTRKGTAIAGLIIGGTLLACLCVSALGGMGST